MMRAATHALATKGEVPEGVLVAQRGQVHVFGLRQHRHWWQGEGDLIRVRTDKSFMLNTQSTALLILSTENLDFRVPVILRCGFEIRKSTIMRN